MFPMAVLNTGTNQSQRALTFGHDQCFAPRIKPDMISAANRWLHSWLSCRVSATSLWRCTLITGTKASSKLRNNPWSQNQWSLVTYMCSSLYEAGWIHFNIYCKTWTIGGCKSLRFFYFELFAVENFCRCLTDGKVGWRETKSAGW